MLKLQKHYLKEFLKLLCLISTGLALIFSILELIDKIDDFMPNKPSFENLLLYAFFNFPKYFGYLLPAAVLICSLFIFSQASRNREFIAIKASGGRLKAIFYPFVTCGVLLSIFAFINGEVVVPDFLKRSAELKSTIKKQDSKITFEEGTLWLRGTDGSPVRIELYIPEKRLAKGISIFIIGKDYLKERIEAEEAKWLETQGSKGIWELRNVIIYDIKSEKVNRVSEMKYPYLESPEFFSEGIKRPDEMGIAELYKYTERLKKSGFRNTKLIVDLNSKVSYPLINLFMILLGVSLSVSSKIGGGLFAAGLGLLISTIYWFTYTLLLSMGYAGVVPPVIAVWLIPVTFGIVSVYLFRRIPE
jgi:lipopolysaccharide export system permease protein